MHYFVTVFVPELLMNQCLLTQFQPLVTRAQCITNNNAVNTPYIGIGDYKIVKLLPLLRNLTLHDKILIGINNFYDQMTLYLTALIRQLVPVLIEFHNFDLSKTLLDLLMPPDIHHLHIKSYQTYLIMS